MCEVTLRMIINASTCHLHNVTTIPPYSQGFKVNIPISDNLKQFLHKCGIIGEILEWIFRRPKNDITTFNMKNYNLFWSIESIINFQRQDSLPTHIYSLGQPISDNGAVLCVKILEHTRSRSIVCMLTSVGFTFLDWGIFCELLWMDRWLFPKSWICTGYFTNSIQVHFCSRIRVQ